MTAALITPPANANPAAARIWGAFPVPGMYFDMSFDEYLAVEAMSNSGAEKINRSPQHYKLSRTQRSEPTDAMQFGTAVHTATLEPEAFASRVVLSPKFDKRTKAGKADAAAFQLAHGNKLAFDADDMARIQGTTAAIRAHLAASKLIERASRREVSLFWFDPKTGVPCKARLDILSSGGIVDLKTTRDASPEEFAKSIANYGYHRQAAHYLAGYRECVGEDADFFFFIAAESDAPHGVAVYELSPADIKAGAHLMARACGRYAEALQAGSWPGYPQTVEQIVLPRWARTFDY